MIVDLIAQTIFYPEKARRLGYRPHLWTRVRVEGADELAELAGRECYQSWTRPNPDTATNAGYLANIIKQGHFSILEHASFTFSIREVSRALTHELVRHRHLSFCLSGDTKVYLDRPNRKHNGTRSSSQTRTLAELWDMWQDRRRTYVKTMTIRTVSDTGHVVHAHVKEVIQSGLKEVFRLRTRDGREIKSSADHLFWRLDGTWSKLRDLRIGDEIVANGVDLLHDREWVRAKVAEGLTTPQIALLTGTKPVTVRKWRRIHDCPAAYGSGTKGRSPWNKGTRGYQLPPHTEEAKHKMSKTRSERYPRSPEKWANGHAAANALFAELRKKGCVICGETRAQFENGRAFIELDHIDNDPTNNDPLNIQALCVPCHKAKTNGTPPMKVYPTQITSIERVGYEMTYDLEMEEPYARFVANGLVVHNSQVSQRYVDESNGEFVLPPEIVNNKSVVPGILLTDAHQEALTIYEKIVTALTQAGVPRKRARQAARAVLPNGHATRLIVTGNVRAWREMITKRGARNSAGQPLADLEMFQLSQEILKLLHIYAPNSVQDLWQRKEIWDEMVQDTLDHVSFRPPEPGETPATVEPDDLPPPPPPVKINPDPSLLGHL